MNTINLPQHPYAGKSEQKNFESHPCFARDNSLLSGLTVREVVTINKQGHKFSPVFKKILLTASGQECAYCGIYMESWEDMRVDHFLPKAHPDSESIENYICCCKTCNSIKGNKTLEEFRFRLAVYNSKLRGVISPSQAADLVAMGVELPIEILSFHFEKYEQGGTP